MLRYRNTWDGPSPLFNIGAKMTFHAPDNGGGNGGGGTSQPPAGNGAGNGGTPNVTSQPGGNGNGNGQPAPGLYDQVNWDEIPEASRAILQAARQDHERVVTENQRMTTEREQARQRELEARNVQPAPNGTQPAKSDPILDHVTQVLRSKGFTQAQIDQQAPILAEVQRGMIPVIREQMGHDLQPLAGTVIARENTSAFTDAQTIDPLGAQLLADDNIAQAVWNVVQQQSAQGKPFSMDAIVNYAKMVYTELQFNPPNNNNNNTPPAPGTSPFFTPRPAMNRSTGGFNFPGSNLRPAVTNHTNPQGREVNDDTRAALASTFADLARTTRVAPAAFPSDRATHGAGARAPRPR